MGLLGRGRSEAQDMEPRARSPYPAPTLLEDDVLKSLLGGLALPGLLGRILAGESW